MAKVVALLLSHGADPSLRAPTTRRAEADSQPVGSVCKSSGRSNCTEKEIDIMSFFFFNIGVLMSVLILGR